MERPYGARHRIQFLSPPGGVSRSAACACVAAERRKNGSEPPEIFALPLRLPGPSD